MPTLSEADYMSEVYDLIHYLSNLDEDRIFRGNQSREVLPEDDSFIIYTSLFRKRIGSNITTFDAEECDDDENGDYADTMLSQVDIQIDYYGEEAQAMAQNMEIFAHSPLCLAWLRKNGKAIRVLHCTEPSDITYVAETEQYVPRWMVTLSICFNSNSESKSPWYEDVTMKAIKNVDVYFKP
jgi:hypothetical protein